MIRRKLGGGNAGRSRVQSQGVSLETSEIRPGIDHWPISVVARFVVSKCTPINSA